jgi:hypothetical protein
MANALESIFANMKPLLGTELSRFSWAAEEGQVNQFQKSLLVNGVDFVSKEEVPLAYSVSMGLWGLLHFSLLQNIGVDVKNVVHGEQSFELIEPIRVGDSYVISQVLSSLFLKQSAKYKQMLLLTIQSTVFDTHGTAYIRQNHTSIQLDENE